MSEPEPFVHDGQGPDVDPVTGDEAETEELPEETGNLDASACKTQPEGATS